jgi:hypothetical protein
MAQLLTRRQMLAATGISGAVFDRMINRGGMALTFGVVRPTVANRYIATDPIFARVVIALSATSRLSQPSVATLVRLNNLPVLETIVRAERESSLVLAFIKGANAVQLFGGTDSELRNHLSGPPKTGRLQRPERLEQVVTIDFEKLIAGVRQRAEAAGFDLGVPLFLMPDDPHYAEIRRELLEIREQQTLRLEEGAAAYVALRQRVTQNVMIQVRTAQASVG